VLLGAFGLSLYLIETRSDYLAGSRSTASVPNWWRAIDGRMVTGFDNQVSRCDQPG
jgi:hypothetical protein